MKQKLLFIYLNILFLLCMSFKVQAQEYTLTDDDVVVENGMIKSCSYDFSMRDIIIPETLDGQTVIAIFNDVFKFKEITSVVLPNTLQSIMRGVFSSNKLESVVIPNSVKKIGRYAFSSNLITNITLPEGITSIPDWMCSYNELVNITIPSSVTTIGRYAFLGNNLISLELQDGLKYIKNNAFMNNKLSSIVLPTTINEIGLDAFSGNPYLTSLILPASVSESWDFINWTDNNGIVYLVNSEVSDFEKGYTANWGYTLKDDDVVVLNGVITSCNYNFAANNITIPDILDGQEIVGIGSTIPGVFAKKNIREIIFPKGLISIGSDSFSNNKLTTVVLPNSVVSIGKHAFYGYNGLSSIQLPTPQIEGSGFLYWIDGKGINWTPGAIVSDYMISYKAVFIYTLTDDDVVVVNGVIESCSYSFKENSIIIPDILDGQEITGIGERVFSAKNIVEITLPNTLIEIGNGAFSNNKIIRSVLPQNLEIIADSAFSNNNIASLDIPISVTSIGKSAFNNSSIRSLKIPSSIVKIEDGCFMGNYDLSEVVFPEGLIEIGEKAFLACYGLSEVTLPSTVTFIGKRAFDLIGSLKSFTLPSPEKTGYTLVHWLDGNNVIHEVGAATSNKSPSYTAVFEINNYLISGIVTGADAVELTLSGDVNETISVNNGGTYEFSVEYYKSVKLVAKKRGYRFETGEYDFPNLWGDKVAVNFIATENPNLFPPTIGERVFSLDENTSAGITLGTIILQDKDIPADEDILFSILDNTGVFSIDPVSGTIIANENSNFNFETTSTVQITVIVNDYKHPDVSKIFTIQINDVNEFPSDIFISTKIINDNVAVGDELATLTTEDVDANQTFTYTIAENPYFKIVSDKLYLKSPLNCNQDPIIAVLITVEDQGGLSFEKEITITVKDVTGPVLPLFPNIVDECSVTVTPPVVVDVCAGEITGTTTDSLFYDVQGNYVINWTFKDGNDNITSQTQNVIIDDVTGPFKNSDTIISTQNYGTEVLFMGQRFVSNMVVVDGIMYTTSWRGENLSSFDLKKPEESFVVLAGGYGELWGITSKDKEIYFSSDQGVIRKYHIETQEVTIVASGLGPLRGIVIKDDYLYFSTTNGFVKRINLLNPASPAEIVVQGLGWLMGIQLNGNQLYIAGNDNAVYTIDINNQLPIVPEVFVTINNAYNIYIVGEEILISSFGGIHVVKENKEIIQLSNRSGVRAIIVFEGDFYFSDFNTGIYKISFDPIYAPIIVEDLNFQCEITQADLTSPVFEDNCAGEITGTTNFDFSKTQEEGTYEITWTFKDGNKNITTQTQQVIIKDTTKPVVDLDKLPTIEVECEVFELIAPTATDNCVGTIIGTHNITFPITGNGTTTEITWTFKDGNKNITTQTQQVIIKDTTKPVVDLDKLPTIEVECEVFELIAPTATDNCTGTIIGTYDVTLPLTGEGTSHAIIWTFDDGNGNSTRQGQVVIIKDVTAPIPELEVLPAVIAACEITDLETPFATDNCVDKLVITNDVTLPITTQGTTIVTWTYDDGNGNTTTQTQNIIIDDVTAPTVEIEVLDDVLAACEVLILETPFATDNCVDKLVITNDVTLPITTQGTTIVTWTYDDGNGNTTTQTQNVIIKDTQKPVVDAIGLETIYVECEVTSLEAPTATDNCVGTITGTHNSTFPITGNGTTTEITWTYDDGNDNITTQTQLVIIEDVSAPEPDDYLSDITGEFDVDLTPPTATDNCVETVTATTTDPVHYDEIGIFTTTWIFDDGHGNISTQTQTVIIGETIESHGFSPNDDGINDTWTIDGIETYPKCRVLVYNRNGTKVYEKIGYKNTWDGYSNTGSRKKMMSGAYYYMIEFNKKGLKPKSGWLYINY